MPRKPRTLFFRDVDSAGFERSPEEYHPMFVNDPEYAGNRTAKPNASAMPNGNPDTTTTGASAGPGMKQTLVASFPTEGRYVYWPVTTMPGTEIWRRDMQSKDDPEKVGGPYQADADSYYHYDQTTSHFRLFKISRQPATLNAAGPERGSVGDQVDWTQREILGALETMSTLQQAQMYFGNPRLNSQRFERELEGNDGAMGVSSHTWESGGKEDIDPDPTKVAVIGFNKVRNHILGRDAQDLPLQAIMDRLMTRSMGKQSSTSDAARRPGIAHGYNNSKLVARRVSALQQMNEAARLAWQRG